jgi:S1-C subfamily serine protease
MKKLFTIPLVGLAALSIASCVSLDEPVIQTDGPTLLRPQARELLGANSVDLVVETKNSVAKLPFHTQLIRQVAEKSKQAVVSIYAKTETPYRIRLIPKIGKGVRVRVPGAGLGSGFFIHPSGYLLTNDHVIHQAAEIMVLTRDGASYNVIVMARDPVFDLALLKIQGSNREFPVLPMGDSEAVGVGDMVIAVGNPLGLGHTVTSGIISQTNRDLSGVSDEDARRVKYIQTDTAINPGSSGGPLITLAGAWIGVNTAGAVDAQGIGFAVPSSQVREFLDEIRAGKGELESP